MKIVTLNIWDLPLWFVPDRKERVMRIAAYLKKLDADIICLQESFDPHHRKSLNMLLDAYETTDARTEARNVFFISFDTTGGLVTFSKFPIVRSTFIPFRKLFLPPIELLGNKGMLVTFLETPHGKLCVLNTHLFHRGSLWNNAIRWSQIRHIFTTLHSRESMPTIIAGDFNEHNLPRHQKFLELMAQHNVVHPFASALEPTYRKENPYATIWMNRIRHSKRLDYIFYNDLDSLHLKVNRYAVLYPDNALSDHNPVVLEMDDRGII